jgi:hypothetical protein
MARLRTDRNAHPVVWPWAALAMSTLTASGPGVRDGSAGEVPAVGGEAATAQLQQTGGVPGLSRTSLWNRSLMPRNERLVGGGPVHLLPDALQHGRGGFGLCSGACGINGACLLRPAGTGLEALSVPRRVIPRGSGGSPARYRGMSFRQAAGRAMRPSVVLVAGARGWTVTSGGSPPS